MESDISVNKRSNALDQDANWQNHRQNEDPIVEQKNHLCNLPRRQIRNVGKMKVEVAHSKPETTAIMICYVPI
jgi:hypothetical protein